MLSRSALNSWDQLVLLPQSSEQPELRGEANYIFIFLIHQPD